MKTKSKLLTMIILMLLILFVKTESKADNIKYDEETDSLIELIPKASSIEKDVPIQIDVYVKNENAKVGGIDTLIEYNQDIFYELKETDIIPNENQYVFAYNTADKSLTIMLNENISDAIMCTITLTPKTTIDITNEKIQLVKLYDMYIAKSDGYIDFIESLNAAIWPRPEKEEKLYLSSDVYKIGDKDIDNYEDGDIYLEKISPETTIAQFINNCKTNGTIEVINSKGETLKETDLVGTNMTIKVTGHGEEFILTAVVMGDLDGNGLVTVTDLSGINQAILKTIELKDAIFKAADLDDNNEITVTDLSGVNQTILKTIKLTYDKRKENN